MWVYSPLGLKTFITRCHLDFIRHICEVSVSAMSFGFQDQNQVAEYQGEEGMEAIQFFHFSLIGIDDFPDAIW